MILELLIIGCIVGTLGLAAWGYHRGKATPQVDLREKLKNLAKDPEAMAREIELGAEKKSRLLSAVDFRSLFGKVHRAKATWTPWRKS